jgi:hypothetical protein
MKVFIFTLIIPLFIITGYFLSMGWLRMENEYHSDVIGGYNDALENVRERF